MEIIADKQQLIVSQPSVKSRMDVQPTEMTTMTAIDISGYSSELEEQVSNTAETGQKREDRGACGRETESKRQRGSHMTLYRLKCSFSLQRMH